MVGAGPQPEGAQVTRVAALGSHGGEAVLTRAGATDADVVQVDVAQVLRPTLRPGDIGIRDHRRAHHVAGSREASAQAGAQVVSVPPYAPDLSPIEPCGSTRKTALRTAQARTREALEQAIAQALATSTVADAHHWCLHCGYTLQSFKNRYR